MFITVCDDGQEEEKASERCLVPRMRRPMGLVPSSCFQAGICAWSSLIPGQMLSKDPVPG